MATKKTKKSIKIEYGIVPNNIWFPDQAAPNIDDMEDIKRYWKREKERCIHGFYLADGQVYISGWLYFHTVYWTIELDKKIINPVTGEVSSAKTKGTPLFRDIEWIVANDLIRCEKEKKIYNLVGSRGFGKSFMSSSFIGQAYTFIDDSECLLTAGNTGDIKKLAEKVNLGLSNIHSVFQKQRLKNNWADEVRAGWKDENDLDKGSNSRVLARNYDDGNNSMATNGTRPLRQIIDEVGKIPGLIKCVLDSMPSWMNDYGFFSTPFITGTGGDMEVGEEAGIIFNNPAIYNVLEIEDEYEGKGKIGRFIPVTLARNEFKVEKTFSEYLGINHPNLDKITILVSDTDRCMKEYVEPRRKKALKSTTSNEIIKEKAYYPIIPSECFLTVSANDFPVEACKEQLNLLRREGFKAQRIELFYTSSNSVSWKHSEDMPVTDYPVKADTIKKGVIEMIEPPIQDAPAFTYVAGIDPYKISESDYSDSLGSVYIFKRMTTNLQEVFQYMPIAWYHGRPKHIRDWYENVRMLLKMYNAIAMIENNDSGFKDYLEGLNELHLLADGQNILKEISPTSKVKAPKGLPATPQMIDHWNRNSVQYTKEVYKTEKDPVTQEEKETIGVVRILDPMLLEEMIKYNKLKGNFDRVRAFGIAVSYAKSLDGSIGKVDVDAKPPVREKIVSSPFNLKGSFSNNSSRYGSPIKSPFSVKL